MPAAVVIWSLQDCSVMTISSQQQRVVQCLPASSAPSPEVLSNDPRPKTTSFFTFAHFQESPLAAMLSASSSVRSSMRCNWAYWSSCQ